MGFVLFGVFLTEKQETEHITPLADISVIFSHKNLICPVSHKHHMQLLFVFATGLLLKHKLTVHNKSPFVWTCKYW